MLSADVNCNNFKLVNVNSTSVSLSGILPLAPEASGSFSATSSYLTPVNVTSNSGIVTPPSGTTDLRFALVDSRGNASVYNILVGFSGAGEKLYGTLQDYYLNEDGGYVTFRYLNSTIGWVVEK